MLYRSVIFFTIGIPELLKLLFVVFKSLYNWGKQEKPYKFENSAPARELFIYKKINYGGRKPWKKSELKDRISSMRSGAFRRFRSMSLESYSAPRYRRSGMISQSSRPVGLNALHCPDGPRYIVTKVRQYICQTMAACIRSRIRTVGKSFRRNRMCRHWQSYSLRRSGKSARHVNGSSIPEWMWHSRMDQ